VKKPAGVTKDQWDRYRQAVDVAVKAASKSLDLIAEANFQAGEITERQRIIKLLEPHAKHDESCYYKRQLACTFEDCHAFEYEYAIKLIKGEQK
jgi:hypothetical protein